MRDSAANDAIRTPAVSVAGEEDATPGLSSIAAVVGATVVLGLLWLASNTSEQSAIDPDTPGVTSELSLVDGAEIDAALTTLNQRQSLLDRFKSRARDCPAPLAWVTVAPTTPGQKGTYRLRSGAYYSPAFALSGGPVRVAIPFPGPYEAGQGYLAVMHEGGDITVALQPPWRVTAKLPSIDRKVMWVPQRRCDQANG